MKVGARQDCRNSLFRVHQRGKDDVRKLADLWPPYQIVRASLGVRESRGDS